jgi:phage-related protein
MENKYTALFFDSVKEMLAGLSETERAKVAVAIVAMREGNFQAVETKILKTPIRELKVKEYRFIFFINGPFLYFLHSFIKQSAKTPKKEIDYAYKIYKKTLEI